jgi:tRNA A-37 threonylcarbamoyl transferase component Bud32
MYSPNSTEDSASRRSGGGRDSKKTGAPQAGESSSIGSYTLEKTIGTGASGKVKLGTHKWTGQRVAIKVLDRQKLRANDPNEKKVHSEINILARISHPHIIRLYEVIEKPDKIYIVLEYIPNKELFDFIVARGRLREAEARALFQQLVSAVDYCHRHGIAHRDLKPENILMDTNNNIKLADFGYSHIMTDGKFLSTSCGSPNYAAPELLSADMYGGPEVDVWSAGVILYTMLCAKLPFDDPHDNMRNLFRLIRRGRYAEPTHVSDAAKDVLSRMLVVEPMKRATMSEIRSHPWFNVDLPAYIATPSMGGSFQSSQGYPINIPVLQKVCAQFNCETEKLLPWLALGRRLVTDPSLDEYRKARRLVVTYHMLQVQDKQALFQGENDRNAQERALGVAKPMEKDKKDPCTPMQWADLFTPEEAKRRSELIRSKQLESESPHHFGLWFEKDPRHIMKKLYIGLKEKKFEWKTLASLYTVRARMKGAAPNSKDPKVASTSLKIEYHLYRVKPPNAANKYILDVQLLWGDPLVFSKHCFWLHGYFQRDLIVPQLGDLKIQSAPPD